MEVDDLGEGDSQSEDKAHKGNAAEEQSFTFSGDVCGGLHLWKLYRNEPWGACLVADYGRFKGGLERSRESGLFKPGVHHDVGSLALGE